MKDTAEMIDIQRTLDEYHGIATLFYSRQRCDCDADGFGPCPCCEQAIRSFLGVTPYKKTADTRR